MPPAAPSAIGKDDDLQLWAPAAKSIDKLGPDELLLLAVIRASSMQLKASTFRGQSIEALESGACSTAQTPPDRRCSRVSTRARAAVLIAHGA